MTNATMQKRLTKLEAEVKLLKKTVTRRPGSLTDERTWSGFVPTVRKIRAGSVSINAKKKTKKLPKWLQASLKDVEEGRVSGPFDTVGELMRHLEEK